MVEWLVYASHSYMHIPEVQWVISPLSPACPISCSPHGVASPAILHSTESNCNPHEYNPTLPPLYQTGGEISVRISVNIWFQQDRCRPRWRRSKKKNQFFIFVSCHAFCAMLWYPPFGFVIGCWSIGCTLHFPMITMNQNKIFILMCCFPMLTTGWNFLIFNFYVLRCKWTKFY